MGQPKKEDWVRIRERIASITQEILSRRRSGHTFPQIGTEFNLPAKTVQAICYRYGVAPESTGDGRSNRRRGERAGLAIEIERLMTVVFGGPYIAKRLGLRDRKEVDDILKYWRTDLPVQRRHTTESLRSTAINYIRSVRRYVGLRELCSEFKIGPATFARHGVSIIEVNEGLGYKAPYSIFQVAVHAVLSDMFPCSVIATEKTFYDLRSPKGRLLKCDFFIESENLIVEADGVQHQEGIYDKTSYFTDAMYRASCDRIKDAYAKKMGIRLVRIPYSGKVTKVYVSRFLEED